MNTWAALLNESLMFHFYALILQVLCAPEIQNCIAGRHMHMTNIRHTSMQHQCELLTSHLVVFNLKGCCMRRLINNNTYCWRARAYPAGCAYALIFSIAIVGQYYSSTTRESYAYRSWLAANNTPKCRQCCWRIEFHCDAACKWTQDETMHFDCQSKISASKRTDSWRYSSC